jgi:ATP-binding cassette subfamily B protein
MGKKHIRDFLRKYWLRYALGAIFLIASSYVQILAPRYLGIIIDLLKEPQIDRDRVQYFILLTILVAFAAFVSRFIWRYFVIGNGRNLENFLRQRLFEHFQKLSVEFFNHRKTGDLVAYAINDITAVRMTFGPGVAMMVNGIAVTIISIGAMAGTVNPRLTLFALLPIPVIVFIIITMGQLVQKRFRRVQESFAAISGRVQENISGIRVIKSYVQEDLEVEKFDQLNNENRQANLQMLRLSSLLTPTIQLFFGLCFMINLLYGTRLVNQGVITLGGFVAFNGYLTLIMNPVIFIGRIINLSQRGMASLKRLNQVFDVGPEAPLGQVDPSITEIQGDLRISNLTFTYPTGNEPTLKDVSINLPRGKTLGIIGKTGSGKTTLINLLVRLYNSQPGMIFMDGRDINQVPTEVLRENTGCVPQDNFLFSATIWQNITFFKEVYSQEEVYSAAEASQILQSILEFPKGFETLVGERGVNLSGGQKQRIAIARAIIRRPKLLILDDALSAVDTKTEESILTNLKTVMRDSTALIVSHRISAVKDADEIIVLEKGQIRERGNHAQLMELGGLYCELYQEQSKEQQRGKVCYEAS